MTITPLKSMYMQLCIAIPSAMLTIVPLQNVLAAPAPPAPSRALSSAQIDKQAQQKSPEAKPRQHPQCADGIVMRAAAALGHPKVEGLAIACKPMPSNPARSIVALVYINGADSAEGSDERDYDLDVLIVNSSDGKVLRRSHLDGAIGSDANRFVGFDIDTANYLLAPGVRAFGVTISHEGSSSVDPSRDTELRLFAEQNGELRQVLDQLRVKEYHGESNGNCNGRFEQVRRTIAPGKAGPHGLADLIVTARSTVTKDILKGEECSYVEGASQLMRTTFRYNGAIYLSPIEPGSGNSLSSPAAGFFYEACNDAYTRGDYATADHLLQPGLAASDNWAQYLKAFNFENGRGVKADHAQALKWHLLAAANGNWMSSYDLGVAFENGNGFKKNISEAIKWYRMATQQGFPNPDPKLAVDRLMLINEK